MASGTFTLAGNMTGFFGTVALGSSGGFFRFNGSSGSANTAFDLGSGTTTLNNRNGVTITLGALSGGSGTFLSGAGAADAPSTYIVGGKNLNTTFAGTIQDSSPLRTTTLSKVGTGVWTLTGNNTYSGTTTVGAGTLLVNGDQSAATNAVTVSAGAKLGGTGIIGGRTTVSGTLAPGTSIGTLTFNTNLILTGTSTTLFELTRLPPTNDVARVLGAVTYNGLLNVVNLSPELLQAGDNFKLFDAAAYSGSFSSLSAPTLDDGLEWNTARLAVDGRLWVVKTTPPAIGGATASGGSFRFNGAGGTPNWYYYVLTSTNLALPLNQWSRAATNQFDGAGNFGWTNSLETTVPQKFYLLQLP
jgi:autotransporter-associated beta strand protein